MTVALLCTGLVPGARVLRIVIFMLANMTARAARISVVAAPRIRMDVYKSLPIPTAGVTSLADLAEAVFQKFALFTWLVTHRAPAYPDGPTDDEADAMIEEGKKIAAQLDAQGPASMALILRGAFIQNPLRNQATERLILLAMIAERPQLITQVLRTFPEASDPILLTALLEPYVNSHLEQYVNLPQPAIKDHNMMQGIATMAKVRQLHNVLLRDAVRARYAMVSVMADPYLFGTSSLTDIAALISKIDSVVNANGALYAPLTEAISRLKINFEKVKGVVSIGAGITIDAIRRLRLALGVMSASDALFDKMTSGSGQQPAKLTF